MNENENPIVNVVKAVFSAPVAFVIANVSTNIVRMVINFVTNSELLGRIFYFDFISYVILAISPIFANAIGVVLGLDAVKKWLGTYKVAAVFLMLSFAVDIGFGIRNHFVLQDTLSYTVILLIQDVLSIMVVVFMWKAYLEE